MSTVVALPVHALCANPSCRRGPDGGPAPLPPPKSTGRPRKTCSDPCRRALAHHRTALPWPPVAPAGYPSDPEMVRRRTAEALVAVMNGDHAAPPEDQLAQALLEIGWIGFELARLERELSPRLAARAGEFARRVLDARRHLFPEVEEV